MDSSQPAPASPDRPPRAADNPLAAAVLGALLVREGQRQRDPATARAGQALLRSAEDHWPNPVPADKRLPR